MFRLPQSMHNLNRKKLFLVMAITLVRLPLALVFGWLYRNADISLSRMWVCTAILALIEFSDGLDGYLARKFQVASEAGAMFDPYTDSLSRLIVYFTFAMNEKAILLVPMVMAIRDVTVAYCRIILARNHVSVKALRSGKIKAVVQAVGAFVLCLSPILTAYTGDILFPIVSWTVIIATAASCLEYIRAAYRAVMQ
jgi:CDP-diacylglycerol---glycerol-3-phosphate 3-phosphatidyltransferase